MKILKSIQFHLSLLFIFLLCSVIAIISSLFLQHEKHILLEASDHRGKLLVSSLVAHATNAILFEDESRLVAQCKKIATYKDVRSAMVIDTNRSIIAHNDPHMIGKLMNTRNYHSILRSDRILIKPHNSKTNKIYSYSVPLLFEHNKIGLVSIIISNNPIKDKMSGTGQKILSLAIIAICSSLFIFIIIIHFLIIKPVYRLTNSIKAAGHGNFTRRIDTKAFNEIGTLTKHVNSLNESLLTQKNHFLKLFTTVQTMDAHRKKTDLMSQLVININDILSPEKCIIALVKNNNLIINKVSGFDPNMRLVGKQLLLPNEEFLTIFQKKASRKFFVTSFNDTFKNLKINFQHSDEEILVSPLIHSKRSKGIIMLIGKRNGTTYNESDCYSLDIVSIATAISLFNIELLEKFRKKKLTRSESYTADLIRNNLLPQKLIKMDGIEMCSLYKPADETHGNWYGFIENKPKRQLSIFIGDAVGRGMQAVLVTATANNFIKTMDNLVKRHENISQILSLEPHTETDTDNFQILLNPANLLSVLNRILYDNSLGKQAMTLFASTIDLENKKIYFANAGHEIPVLIKNRDGSPLALASSGPCLGDTSTAIYEEHSLDLDSGDVITWYTAGLTQCTNTRNEPFGKMRLLSKLREYSSLSSKDICKNITHDILNFNKNKTLIDDITLVTAKII